MSNKGNFLISLLILALGVVFIWMYDRTTLPQYIVTLCGLAFVVPAVISLMSVFLFNKKGSANAAQRIIQMVCGVGGLGLGLIIIILPDLFRPLLIYPFAFLIVFGGLFQIFQLSQKHRPVDYPSWLHVGPIVLIAAGVVLFCLPGLKEAANEAWVVLVTGIAAIIYGINGIIISVLGRTMKKREPAKTTEATASESASTEPSGESASDAEK